MKTPEATIQRLLKRMSAADVDALVADDNAEFKTVADAVMAWYQMLVKSGILKTEGDDGKRAFEVLASSLLVLGTIVKTAYALGLRAGQKNEG